MQKFYVYAGARAARVSRSRFVATALLTMGIAGSTLLAGCGGSNNRVETPLSIFRGTYGGTWQFAPTTGTPFGGTETIVVDGFGHAVGTFTDTTTGAHSFTANDTVDTSGNLTPITESTESKDTVVGAPSFSGRIVGNEITGSVNFDFPGSGTYEAFKGETPSPSPSASPTVE